MSLSPRQQWEYDQQVGNHPQDDGVYLSDEPFPGDDDGDGYVRPPADEILKHATVQQAIEWLREHGYVCLTAEEAEQIRQSLAIYAYGETPHDPAYARRALALLSGVPE